MALFIQKAIPLFVKIGSICLNKNLVFCHIVSYFLPNFVTNMKNKTKDIMR